MGLFTKSNAAKFGRKGGRAGKGKKLAGFRFPTRGAADYFAVGRRAKGQRVRIGRERGTDSWLVTYLRKKS